MCEEKVDSAIAEYLAACDAGAMPEREAFLAKFPDLADSLAGFIDDHQKMRKILPDQTVGFETSSMDEAERVRYFGDYELVDEIARGGMGVVFRAKQVSLNRIVALKMVSR